MERVELVVVAGEWGRLATTRLACEVVAGLARRALSASSAIGLGAKKYEDPSDSGDGSG